MKATHSTRRRVLCTIGAVALSAVMLASVSCTRNDVTDDPKDTTAGTTAGTATDKNENNPGIGNPLDPDAGTVSPDAAPGDPPAGTGEGRGMRSHFMH